MNKKFYNSIAWRKCRDAYSQSVNGLCEICLSKGKLTVGQEVHHKIPLTLDNVNDPNIALNWDNLQLLCFECHQGITHNRQPILREGLAFDDKGNIIVN